MVDLFLLFSAGFILDIFFCLYTIAIQSRRSISAANWAGCIAICSMLSFGGRGKEGLDLFLATMFWAGGQWLGTIVAIKISEYKSKK
jgi:hypothetical protein